ncbi:hypothetical protein GCM10009836_49900 [Pseudonocardia ailaonensis]|uniref:HTH tetR-type domain-containing protein n=1 Tax=Pseudonocardia ailaonensis TaxID=367279 RepID=A0ABN2ND10_9PSEU
MLDATTTLLRDVGFARLTIDAISERSGVAKATIYRWWNNRSDVAMEALLGQRGPSEPFVHEGSALSNLRTHLTEAAGFLSGPTGRLVAGIVGDAQHDAQIARAFRERFLAQRRTLIMRLLAAAVAEGDVRPDVDHDVLVDLLTGALYYRLLVTGAPLSADVADRALDTVLQGVRPGPAPDAPPSAGPPEHGEHGRAALSDDEWSRVAPLLPAPHPRGGRPQADLRMVLAGIVYRHRTGIAWRDLPRDRFGPWQTVWKWHRHLVEDGTWPRIWASLRSGTEADEV